MAFDATQTSTTASDSWLSCAVCPAASQCLAADAPATERARWHELQRSCVPLAHAGKALYATGEPAHAVFVVRAGCLKTFTVDEDGNERVRGFHFPGDIVGLDAIGTSAYPSNAVSVMPSQVCRIAKGQLQALLTTAPGLLQRLLERTSRELRQALALSGDYSADQRLAAFLLLMQHRLAARASGPASFRLPMTRRDIANYLRLATETVCRVLTRFEDAGWLATEEKSLRVLKAVALQQQAEPVGLVGMRGLVSLAA